jgi:hypothetical protein
MIALSSSATVALPAAGHAGAYLTGKATMGSAYLIDPKIAVWDVKCKVKAPICASVWDQSPDFSYQDNFHVTTLCLNPLAAKGKGGMEFYMGIRDGGDFSPTTCTPACAEALVMVECDLLNYLYNGCDDTFAASVACNGSDFAAGFPKKVQ